MNRGFFLIGLLTTCGMAFAQAQPQTPPPQTPPPQTPGPVYVAPSQNLQYYQPQTPAVAWQYDMGLSAGYSNVIFNHTGGLNYSRDGGFIDFGADFNTPQTMPVVFGAGLTATGTFDNYQINFQSLYSEITMVSFEGRAELPLAFNHNQGFFVTPRIGAGPLLNDFYAQLPFGGYHHHTGVAFELRPGVKVGYRFLPGGNAAVGVDGSYMASWGDFGNFGSFGEELRIGAFFSWRF
jgi:hypothetical protein